MNANRIVARILLLISLAMFIFTPSNFVLSQTSTPEGAAPTDACSSILTCPQTQVSLSAGSELQLAATPGMSYQSFSGILFYPYESSVNHYVSFGYGTHVIVSPSWSGELVMPLALPDGVDVKELTFYFRDNNQSYDPQLAICIAPITTNAVVCNTQTPATDNSGSIISFTMTGSPILTIDNANNSYFLAFYMPVADPGFGLVSARIGFQRSVYLPTVQKQ